MLTGPDVTKLNLKTSMRGFRIGSSSIKFEEAMKNIFPDAHINKRQTTDDIFVSTAEGCTPGPERDHMGLQSLFLSSPPQFEIQSSFGPLFNMDPKKLKLAYEISSTLNGQHDTFESLSAFGFQVWEGSQPLKITVELKFFKGMWGWHDARNEVFNPIALLCETVLPTEGAGGILISPSPNYYVGLTQLLQTYATIMSNMSEGIAGFIGSGFDWLLDTNGQIRTSFRQAASNVANKISGIILGFASQRSQSRGTYNLHFGSANTKSMEFYNYICEQASPQFSLEVDEDGYPIWGTLRLTFASVFSANVSHFPMQYPLVSHQS